MLLLKLAVCSLDSTFSYQNLMATRFSLCPFLREKEDPSADNHPKLLLYIQLSYAANYSMCIGANSLKFWFELPWKILEIYVLENSWSKCSFDWYFVHSSELVGASSIWKGYDMQLPMFCCSGCVLASVGCWCCREGGRCKWESQSGSEGIDYPEKGAHQWWRFGWLGFSPDIHNQQEDNYWGRNPKGKQAKKCKV